MGEEEEEEKKAATTQFDIVRSGSFLRNGQARSWTAVPRQRSLQETCHPWGFTDGLTGHSFLDYQGQRAQSLLFNFNLKDSLVLRRERKFLSTETVACQSGHPHVSHMGGKPW